MILIGLGANLSSRVGAPKATLAAALEAMPEQGIRVVARSRLWSSPAWPPSDQPPFVNAVARVASDLGPAELLARLHAVEHAFGRQRGERWAARTLDLDLLCHDGQVVIPARDGDLALPHPRLAARAFVLMPLRDVAPDWRHPVDGRTIDQLIAALPPDQSAAPLED
jgi:2-amino-4-hydroxy-6-hydroxymethyldihydropteridine diphosphokinase